MSPGDVPRLEQATIDWRLAFTLGVGVACSVIWFDSVDPRRRPRADDAQKAAEDTAARAILGAALVAGRSRARDHAGVGSALLIRTAWLTQHVDPGFDPHGVMTAQLILPMARYQDGAAIVRAYETLRDETSRLPGVAPRCVGRRSPVSR